jgi:H+/Cl- antiporter ClcA
MAGEGEVVAALNQTYVFGSPTTDYLYIIVLGIVGGFAFALLLERGIIFPFRETTKDGLKKWNFGFVADLIIGAIAAVVAYSFNPPDTIPQFIAIGITSGIGGKAILTGYIETKKSQRLRDLIRYIPNEYRVAFERSNQARGDPALSEELDRIDKKYKEMKWE